MININYEHKSPELRELPKEYTEDEKFKIRYTELVLHKEIAEGKIEDMRQAITKANSIDLEKELELNTLKGKLSEIEREMAEIRTALNF